MIHWRQLKRDNRFFVASAVITLLSFTSFSLLIGTVFAFTLLGDREIRMGSSQPGDVNDYTVEFDVSTTGNLGGIVITFCTNTPTIGDPECEAPNNFRLGNRLDNLSTGDIDLSSYYATPSQHISSGSSQDNTVTITPKNIQDTNDWSLSEDVSLGNDGWSVDLMEAINGYLFWSFGSQDNTARIHRSLDGGESWSEVSNIGAGNQVRGVILFEASNGNLFWTFYTTSHTYLYSSTDNGANWALIEDLEYGSFSIDRAADLYEKSTNNHLFWATKNGLFRSVDGGITWTEIVSLENTILETQLIEDSNGDILWLTIFLTDIEIRRSIDGGANWSEPSTITAPNNLRTIYAFLSSSGNLFLSFGTREPDNTAYLYRSTDNGYTWGLVESVFSGGTTSCCYINFDYITEISEDELLWTFGDQAGFAAIYKSADGGATWAEVQTFQSSDGFPVRSVRVLATYEGDVLWSVGSGTSSPGRIYRSTDNGDTWQDVYTFPGIGVGNSIDLLEASSGDLFVGVAVSTNRARLYRTNSSSGDSVASLAGNTAIFDLLNVTNQSTQGTFYARIYTYADPEHALGYTLADPWAGGDVVDAGGVALSTAETIDIQFMVPERLTFCVFTSALSVPGDFETCTGTSTDPVSLGDSLGFLSPEEPSISKDTKYNIATNAAFGATIRVRGETLSSGSLSIDPIGDSSPGDGIAVTSSVGTEQFGLCTYQHPSSVEDGITPLAPYNSPNCAGTTDGQATGNDNNALFGFDQTNLTSQYGHAIAQKAPGEWSTGILVLLANITDFTEAGVYNTTFDVVSTGRY